MEQVGKTDILDSIESLAMEGSTTDGEHHKQWCLMEILRLIIGDEELEKLQETYYGMDDGSPP